MGIRWFISWVIMFPLLKVLTGVTVIGSVPRKGPLILACNHVSFLDPPAVGITANRELYFLAKVPLFRLSAFFTWLIRTYHAIPIADTQGLRTALHLLKQGHGVVIFPEGTRSRIGTMLPFNPGASYLSINCGVPVIPVYVANSNKKFVSLVLRMNRLTITFGKPIYPSGYTKTREDYERFAVLLKQEVEKLR